VSCRRASIALAALACAVAAVALGASQAALAHPLGNFTTNQLAQVRIGAGEARVHYVLDQAEIPSFQQLQRYDGNGSGAIDTAGERRQVLGNLLGEISSGLELTANGRPVPLRSLRGPQLAVPPGQGGLSLTRVEAWFATALLARTRQVELTNDAFAGHVGWDAIQILPGEGTDVSSSVPATDPTNGLRAYPENLLSSPPSDRRATFEVTPGSGQVTAPSGPTGGEATADRSLDGFANALAGGNTHGLLIIFLLAAAFGWGALHALSPGHGKAMVAGYLVGARGSPRQAAILGLTVTATHTVSVFALGLVTLAASQYVLPEQLYPWLGVLSGLLVVGIGLTVMRSRFRRWRALRSAHRPGWIWHRDGPGSNPPRHGAHSDAHAHQHSHGHGHAHDGPREPLTMRGLIGLGVSGGIVPCPSALVVLIAAISQHRVGLGMALILAFSLGLAATLTAVGLAVVWGGRLITRLRPERRLFGSRFAGLLPAVSASVIVLAGVLITSRAIPQLG
jgi:ABC-type nickel/cobalt efflux system permease component RcnA